MDKIGKLEKIQYSPSKGSKMIRVSETKVHPILGISEDYHCVQGNSELTIWEMEIRRKLEDENFDGLCFSRFKENLLVSGLNLQEIKEGAILRINQLDFKITKKGKSCYSGCVVKQRGEFCPLRTGILFATALQEGVIRQGDRIYIQEDTK